jgi:hypothetical protein
MAIGDLRVGAATAAGAASSVPATPGARLPNTASLARGGSGAHPDVDCLVAECPRHLRHGI